MIGRGGRRELQAGDRIVIDGKPGTVIGVSGRLRFAFPDGEIGDGLVADLLAAGRLEFPAVGERAPRKIMGTGLAGLPADVLEQASWWEAHIAEIVHGLPPDSPAGRGPRPEYDPELTSLTSREQAKAAELAAAGHPVPVSTLKHRRQRWVAYGLPGLVDQRLARCADPAGRVHPAVAAAMQRAIDEATGESSKTAAFIIWRAKELLAAAGEQAEAPSRATMYRLFARLSAGRHTTGSAVTRRSLAGRPQRMFSAVHPAAPGELMEIDSTPLDVMVLLDDGIAGRADLTGMIDVATRTVTAAVLRPTTRSVDASVLLARSLTPEPMRPGWAQALAMAHSALPYDRLLSIDDRMAHAAARPVIIPDTIAIDHGSVFVSANFRASCRHLGISIQPVHLASGSEKPHIERTFGSVASLFCQFVSGYVGRNPDRRGRSAGAGPLWSLLELQDLLDEWLIACWQNRPHDGLRDPGHPGRAFTPNEKYAALAEAAGYLPVPLDSGDYIELLPATWRAVNAYGIKIRNRTYDSEELNPVRMQKSGISQRKGLWEIHYDPYDVSRVFVRGPDGWVTAFWKHLNRVPEPFGDLAWDHARRIVRDREDAGAPAEELIADEVAALLKRAHHGPGQPPDAKTSQPSRRDLRVAARTRATRPGSPSRAPVTGERDAAEPAPAEPAAGQADEGAGQDHLAKVIPLGIFDPFAEADKRW